jgi:hypothetical protein
VSTSGSTNAAASIQPATLRRVTPYVNPDRLRQAIQAHGTRFEPIQNVAVSTFQMRAGGVSRTLTEDTTRQWQSDLGDVYPEDRHVLVNHSICERSRSAVHAISDFFYTATILQYRNRDFDMEDCVLSVTVPTSTNDFDPATSLIDGSLVDVWALADAEELFLHGTSRIASPRRHKMMTVNLARATNSTSSPFQCPSGNFTTLELACSGQGGVCSVDFWQTRAVKTGGSA